MSFLSAITALASAGVTVFDPISGQIAPFNSKGISEKAALKVELEADSIEESDFKKIAEEKVCWTCENEKSNFETHSLILKGLTISLKELGNNPVQTLDSKQEKTLKEIAELGGAAVDLKRGPNELCQTAQRYKDLRRLKRALINAKKTENFPQEVVEKLKLMTEALRLLQLQTAAGWSNMAITRAQEESEQEAETNMLKVFTSKNLVAAGLNTKVDTVVGKVGVSFGVEKTNITQYVDDNTINASKEKTLKLGLNIEGNLGIAKANLSLEGRGKHIEATNYATDADFIAAKKIKKINSRLPDFVRVGPLATINRFSRTKSVENLCHLAQNSVPRLQELVQTLKLEETINRDGEKHVIKVNDPGIAKGNFLSHQKGWSVEGKLNGNVEFISSVKLEAEGKRAEVRLYTAKPQSFLDVQKTDPSELTDKQLEVHKLRLKKMAEKTEALVPKDKLSVSQQDGTNDTSTDPASQRGQALLNKQSELLTEVLKYDALCKELDLAVYCKKKSRIQELKKEKRSIESSWNISGSGKGRSDYFQTTLLAFCSLNKQWQDLSLPEGEQQTKVQKLEDQMTEFLANTNRVKNDLAKFQKATCFLSKVPSITKTSSVTIAVSVSNPLGADDTAKNTINGEIGLEHTQRTNSSRLRDGSYLDISFALGSEVKVTADMIACMKPALLYVNMSHEEADKIITDLADEFSAQAESSTKLKGSVQIRLFSPSERYARNVNRKEEDKFRLLYVRTIGELSQKEKINVDVPVPGAEVVSVGGELRHEYSVSTIIKEYIGTNTLCYLATQHHGRQSSDPKYLSDWNKFLKPHPKELGRLFIKLADPKSHVSQEAKFILSQEPPKIEVAENDASENKPNDLNATFFESMRAYQDCANQKKASFDPEKVRKAFIVARDQLTALFEHDLPHWTKEKSTATIYYV